MAAGEDKIAIIGIRQRISANSCYD